MKIKVNSLEEVKLKEELKKREDPEAKRMIRFLEMPDLSRTSGNPLAELAQKIKAMSDFEDFDEVEAPEIVSTEISFDLFDFPANHPARSKSDTYFANDDFILRTHTTVMWYFHLKQQEVREKINRGESVGALSHGKVYRKDEIDRNHMNIFHQMDGWFLCRREEKNIGREDLEDILNKIVKTIFGPDIEYRFNPDTFPYTDPSLEIEVKIGDRWIEVLGAGVVSGKVLENLGVDSKVWSGWAFGFGLERLAILSMDLPDIRLLWSEDERVKKQLKLGAKFQEVSKFPPAPRDISFIVPNSFVPNNYFDLIRDIGGDLIEEVELLDKYENAEKFGVEKTSYTYRIIYRSMDRTLTSDEVEKLHKKIEEETKRQFSAEIR